MLSEHWLFFINFASKIVAVLRRPSKIQEGLPTLPEELSCLHRAENDKVLTVKPSKRLKGGLSFS